MTDWLKHNSPHMFRFLQILLILFLGLIVTYALSIGLAALVYNKSLPEIMQAVSTLDSPGNIDILKFMQVIQSICLFIIPSFIIVKSFRQNIPGWLKLNTAPTIQGIMLIMLIMVLVIPFINYLSSLNEEMKLPNVLKSFEEWMKSTENYAQKLTEAFLKMGSVKGLLFNLFMMALLPAFGEELLFRGVIQRVFSEWFRNIHWGIFLSAAFFSAFHLQFYGFIPRLLLGVMFGYFLVWSGSLWLPVAGHFMNNALAVIYYFFFSSQKSGYNLDTVGSSPDTYWYAVGSAIITISLLCVLYYHNKQILKKSGHGNFEW
jgi:hypothetical protein